MAVAHDRAVARASAVAVAASVNADVVGVRTSAVVSHFVGAHDDVPVLVVVIDHCAVGEGERSFDVSRAGEAVVGVADDAEISTTAAEIARRDDVRQVTRSGSGWTTAAAPRIRELPELSAHVARTPRIGRAHIPHAQEVQDREDVFVGVVDDVDAGGDLRAVVECILRVAELAAKLVVGFKGHLDGLADWQGRDAALGGNLFGACRVGLLDRVGAALPLGPIDRAFGKVRDIGDHHRHRAIGTVGNAVHASVDVDESRDHRLTEGEEDQRVRFARDRAAERANVGAHRVIGVGLALRVHLHHTGGVKIAEDIKLAEHQINRVAAWHRELRQ